MPESARKLTSRRLLMVPLMTGMRIRENGSTYHEGDAGPAALVALVDGPLVDVDLNDAAIAFFNPDILFRQLILSTVKVTGTTDTPYGNITSGTYKGEKDIFYNQRLLAYNDDVAEREEDIHYALLQCKTPKQVMLISGSLKSRLSEILKYRAQKIIYIERDPVLSAYADSVATDGSYSLQKVNMDASRFLKNCADTADAIISLSPPPTSLLNNRYFTYEFFIEVHSKLKKGGTFICSPGPGDYYLNKEALKMYSSIFVSLGSVFRNVSPVVGNKLYFIASDDSVSLSFCKMVSDKQIKNLYVNSDYLSDENIRKKSLEVASAIDKKSKLNRLSYPIACFHSQSYQFSKDITEKTPVLIALIILFAIPVIIVKRQNIIMYCSASSLAGFEIIILLTLQIAIGNMYQLTGLIIAALMSGLAVGSALFTGPPVNVKMVILAVFYLLFAFTFDMITKIGSAFLSLSLIVIAVFLPALLTGSVFKALTSKAEGIRSASAIYGADLSGSALGFIFVSGLSVPLFGIRVTVFILAAQVVTGILLGGNMKK